MYYVYYIPRETTQRKLVVGKDDNAFFFIVFIYLFVFFFRWECSEEKTKKKKNPRLFIRGKKALFFNCNDCNTQRAFILLPRRI